MPHCISTDFELQSTKSCWSLSPYCIISCKPCPKKQKGACRQLYTRARWRCRLTNVKLHWCKEIRLLFHLTFSLLFCVLHALSYCFRTAFVTKFHFSKMNGNLSRLLVKGSPKNRIITVRTGVNISFIFQLTKI